MLHFMLIIFFTFNGMKTPLIASAQSPEDFVVKVLSDRYLRSPIMILVEGCNRLIHKVENIWSKILELPPGVELTVAPYNSSEIGNLVSVTDTHTIHAVMDYLKTTTHRTRCKSNFDVFTVIKEASDIIPYDSAIILMISHPPNDPEMQLSTLQALIHKRCKLQVMWLEKSEVPGKYFEISQRTGGEIYEIDDENDNWSFINETNELEDDIINTTPLTTTTESSINERFLPQQVMIAVKRGVQDSLKLPIQVDSSMKDLFITTSGSIYKASIRLPSGIIKTLNLQNTTKVPTEMEIGVWQLEADGSNYNVTVHATSRLAYSATVGKRNQTNPTGRNIDLVRLQGEGVLDRVVLVDEMGKELTKLEHADNKNDLTNIKYNFDNYNHSNGYNNYNSEWLLPQDRLLNKQYYVQVFGQDNNGSKFTRLSSLRAGNFNYQKPVIVELNELSQIVAQPGQTINLYFDVINNFYQPIDMMFYAQDNLNYIRGLTPRRKVVMPHTRIQVNMILEVQTASQQTVDTVILNAESYIGIITAKSYLYIGYQRSESNKPDIDYVTDGYCRETLSPSVCYSNWWSMDASIKDDSGLLRIQSIPNGLQFKSEFIAGTKDVVRIHYSSTCCDTKVDIIAYDVNGNIKKKTIDIEKVWLTAGEITAIVLGVILAIIVLILIIIICVLCIRRRRKRNFLMHR